MKIIILLTLVCSLGSMAQTPTDQKTDVKVVVTDEMPSEKPIGEDKTVVIRNENLEPAVKISRKGIIIWKKYLDTLSEQNAFNIGIALFHVRVKESELKNVENQGVADGLIENFPHVIKPNASGVAFLVGYRPKFYSAAQVEARYHMKLVRGGNDEWKQSPINVGSPLSISALHDVYPVATKNSLWMIAAGYYRSWIPTGEQWWWNDGTSLRYIKDSGIELNLRNFNRDTLLSKNAIFINTMIGKHSFIVSFGIKR